MYNVKGLIVMKKIQKIGMSIIAPILSAGLVFTPTANAFMMTDFAPADDETSRSIVQTGNLNCTGVLIAPQYVLTASHCVSSQPYGEIDRAPESVYIGPDVENREKVNVESAVTHPIYDVALLKLKDEAKTIPAKLYTGTVPLDLRDEVSGYGWGTLSAAKQSSDLIDKESLDSLHKNVAANKVRKAEGTIVNGRLNVDENGEPIRNENGQLIISRYTSAKGFSKMKGENAGVNIKFIDPSKSVYGDSGAPIFSGDTVYGILSGGLLHAESLNEGSTIVASPMHKILPWIQEETGIDFYDKSYNKAIDEKLQKSQLLFKDEKISPEDIERERTLIGNYKESLKESDKYETNNEENGDTEVEAPIDQEDKVEEIENTESDNSESQKQNSFSDNTDTQRKDNENNSSSNERYTVTDSDGKIIDYGYGDVSEHPSNEKQSDSRESSKKENSTSQDSSSDNIVGISTQETSNDVEDNSPVRNDSPGTESSDHAEPVSYDNSGYQETESQDTLNNTQPVGPKVDTGGKVHTSIVSKIIGIFR